MMRRRLWAMALAGLLALPAQADTVASLRAELSALGRVVSELAQEMSSGSAASTGSYDGSVLDRLERITSELANLTGRHEELEFRLRRVIDDASNRLGDLEFRLTELEGGDPTAVTQRPLGGGQSPTPAEPELAAGEQAAFDAARDMIETDPSAAANLLESFLDLYPGSPLSFQASMALAQLYRDSGEDARAARAYLNLYMAAPDAPSAAPALFALGETLARLDQMTEACIMFAELQTRFADTPEADRAAQARSTLACP